MSAPHDVKVGFAGDAKVLQVQLPPGDVPPWDLDKEFSVVGTAMDRLDGVAKVTGRARYTFDVNLPGMLYGLLVRSTIARGRIKSVDTSEAAKAPGVVAVLRTKDDGHRVRFVGDDVVALAAETLDQARDAAELVRIEYDVEEHVTDFRKAEGAPRLDGDGQIVDPWPESADIEAGLAAGKARVEATWSCEVQTHSALESHGTVAWWKPDEGVLEVWSSTQAVSGTQQAFAAAAKVPQNKVRVHAEYVGGGFGAKFPPGAEGLNAVRLSMATGRPVKLMLDRYEEHTCAGNRPSAIMQIRAAADESGKLTAWDYRSFGGPGYSGQQGGTSWPTYYVAHLPRGARRTAHKDLATDTDAGRAMRAPGRPQGFFAAEGALDELAVQLGMDPLDLRLANDPSPLRRYEWQLGAERFGWKERRNPEPGKPRDPSRPWLLQGAGLASATWGQLGGGSWKVTCRIHQDGTVEVRNAAQDIGTGLKTVLAAIVAEELGVPLSRVRATTGDTIDPAGPASGGSTTTPSLAPAARLAAARARQKLVERVAAALGVDAAQLGYEQGHFRIDGQRKLSFVDACRRIGPEPIEEQGERFRNYAAYQDHVCGCQFAEVEVDARTGLVRVTRMLAVQDTGLVLAKKLAESQVLGALIQGISYALHERRVLDHRFGRMLNGDFNYYKIAGSVDTPVLDVVLVPVANGGNNVGAAGLGEPPATAPAAAIHNAVANALGVPVRALPITPDRVLKALATKARAAESKKEGD
ncbi:MAG TPA: xanthine dehydrogenase family protein molybdopterin-binding subunit [Planctomycetota bacterium]|nr:xanthine dehydrogenase family protein molybdopterin-binding subunit [Planctomycetota bacterium]